MPEVFLEELLLKMGLNLKSSVDFFYFTKKSK